MARRIVIGDLRVQEVRRPDGRVEHTIMHSGSGVHAMADGFLRTLGGGTERTYAHLLVDHLRWLEVNGLACELVELTDLRRYMGAVGAIHAAPLGSPWRQEKGPYGAGTLKTAAACLKGFYKFQASRSVNIELGRALDQHRLPSRQDKNRALLGHLTTEMSANPISPKRVPRRRTTKLPPEGALEAMLESAASSRDRLIVTWLAHGGFRVGELCSLRLSDLHLRERAQCGEARQAHVHICHRENNTNRARVKIKRDWRMLNESVTGGTVRLVSPAMIHAYFEYIRTEYPAVADHDMLLVQSGGLRAGDPLSTTGVRAMVERTRKRAGLSHFTPHAFRHQFATDVLDAADGNAVIARDAGGWASATTVEEIYAHTSPEDPTFLAALNQVWGVKR